MKVVNTFSKKIFEKLLALPNGGPGQLALTNTQAKEQGAHTPRLTRVLSMNIVAFSNFML